MFSSVLSLIVLEQYFSQKSSDMNTIILTFVALAGLIATVNCACVQNDATTCATDQSDEIQKAGTDMSKLCSAYRTYITCLVDAGCEDDSSYKSTIATLKDTIDRTCGGSMVTFSIATMLITLFTVLFK